MAVHKRKVSKFFGLYNIGRQSNSGLGLRSPNVERNYIICSKRVSFDFFSNLCSFKARGIIEPIIVMPKAACSFTQRLGFFA